MPTNRLIHETSPYLLQHAHNPVEWYPWGEEAFAEARRRGVPIFLSIGYSTCYWCHVMERESFEDAAVGALLSDRFVCIKVDREERPDVDDVYMAATVAMTGHGGWPMSVFLEPERLRPFWCGTYFPPEPARGLPGITQVVEAISRAWRERRGEVLEQAEKLAAAAAEGLSAAGAAAALGDSQVEEAVGTLLRMLDRNHGGFGGAPKFPQPALLEFLQEVRRFADGETGAAIDHAVKLTLDKMACGGIRDHLGGGFHRYSVDNIWLVPHFEKMLYDQAQLAVVYGRSVRAGGGAEHARVLRSTLDYVRREMTEPGGGFRSAQDAEVDAREGLNYLWTPEEVRAVLRPEDAEFAGQVFGLDLGPNFRDPHHPEEPARNVLRLGALPEELAPKFGVSVEAFIERLESESARLLEARRGRKQPGLDDKVIAAWNGLMIAGFCASGEREDVEHAARAARALLRHRTEKGDLLRIGRAGVVKTPGVLEDYAMAALGMLALARAGEREFLEPALGLIERASERFGDGSGGWFDTAPEQRELFVRARSTHDGALPCGASVMLHALIDAFEATKERAYLERAAAGLRSMSAAVAAAPVGCINSVRALARLLALDRDAAAGLALGARSERAEPESVVEIYADTERVTLKPGEAAAMMLLVRIREGFHVPAAEPGDESLVPFRVSAFGGEGVAVYADYPPGEAYGAAGEVRIYRGEFELPVVLEREGEWKGRPLLWAAYQPCSDRECLAPERVELDVAIDPA